MVTEKILKAGWCWYSSSTGVLFLPLQETERMALQSVNCSIHHSAMSQYFKSQSPNVLLL